MRSDNRQQANPQFKEALRICEEVANALGGNSDMLAVIAAWMMHTVFMTKISAEA